MSKLVHTIDEDLRIKYLNGEIFNQVDNMLRQVGACIVPLLDYYSAMCREMSLNDVLSTFKLDKVFDQGLFCESVKSYPGIRAQSEAFIFSFNYIEFSVPLATYYYKLEQGGDVDDLMNFRFPSIRLCMSGTGMAYLRSLDPSYEFYLRTLSDNRDQIDVTRVDITFDFLNWDVDLCSTLLKYCRMVEEFIPSNRIGICNKPSSYVYSCISRSNERSVYIGSGDQVLRVYDKKLQYYTPQGVLKDIKKPCPYGNDIDTWTRIELQLRNVKAHQWLYSICSDNEFFLACLNRIVDEYKFLDIDEKRYLQKPATFWKSLWDIQDIGSIILNRNCVPKEEKPIIDVIKDFLECHKTRITESFDLFGFMGYIDSINQTLQEFNNGDPKNVEHDRKIQRARRKFLSDRLSYSSDPSFNGFIRFNSNTGKFYYLNKKEIVNSFLQLGDKLYSNDI